MLSRLRFTLPKSHGIFYSKPSLQMVNRKMSSISFTPAIENHLRRIKERYNIVETELSSGTVAPDRLARLGKEFSDLGRTVANIDRRLELQASIEEYLAMSEEAKVLGGEEGAEMVAAAESEILSLKESLKEAEEALIVGLTPTDEDDSRSVVLEVRAGTGGDEASLFASEVFKMYRNLATLRGWKWEEMGRSETEIGGFKDATAAIRDGHGGSDVGVFQVLKFESGVHRVQRVPVNDTKIHTSAASVVVMPEATELDVTINNSDLRIDVYRSGGAGGQSVNKTESAVRITHLPTGIVVAMQDERSQIQNRAKAMQVLRSRILAHERRKVQKERMEIRMAQGGTGDRSDKIRTYNFPQDRVTDHRVGVTVNSVERVLSAELLDTFTDALISADEKERVQLFLDRLSEGKN